MAETLVDKETEKENIYGMTPEIREQYRQRLEQMIKEQGIKAAQSVEDLYRHSDKSEQTPEEIRAEVDEFLQMREEERKRELERGR